MDSPDVTKSMLQKLDIFNLFQKHSDQKWDICSCITLMSYVGVFLGFGFGFFFITGLSNLAFLFLSHFQQMDFQVTKKNCFTSVQFCTSKGCVYSQF